MLVEHGPTICYPFVMVKECQRIIQTLLVLALLGCIGCSSVETEDSKVAELHLRVGTGYLTSGKYRKALSELLIALKHNPSDPFVHNNLGITYFSLKKNDLAANHLVQAVTLKPDYSDARNNLGRVYIEMGIYDKAISELTVVTNDLTYLNPNKALINLGLAYLKKGSLQQANKTLFSAIKSDRTNCLAYNYYGQTLFRQEKLSDASVSLDQAVGLCRKLNFDEPHYYSALAYLKMGHKEKATARFHEVIDLFPDGDYAQKSKIRLKELKETQ